MLGDMHADSKNGRAPFSGAFLKIGGPQSLKDHEGTVIPVKVYFEKLPSSEMF